MDETMADERSSEETEMVSAVSVAVGSVRNRQLRTYRTQKKSSVLREECKLLNQQIKTQSVKNEELRNKKQQLAKSVARSRKEHFSSVMPFDVGVGQAAAAVNALNYKHEESLQKIQSELEENLKVHKEKFAEIDLQWKEVPVIKELEEKQAKIASLKLKSKEKKERREANKQTFISNCLLLAEMFQDNLAIEDFKNQARVRQAEVDKILEQKAVLLSRIAEKEAELQALKDARQSPADNMVDANESANVQLPVQPAPAYFKPFPVYDYAEFDDTADYGESQQEELTCGEDETDLDSSVLSLEQTMDASGVASTFPTSGPLATSTPLSADAMHRRNEEANQFDREAYLPTAKRLRLEPLLEEIDVDNADAVNIDLERDEEQANNYQPLEPLTEEIDVENTDAVNMDYERDEEHMSTIDFQQQANNYQLAHLQMTAQYGNVPRTEAQGNHPQLTQNMLLVGKAQNIASNSPQQDRQRALPDQINQLRVAQNKNSEQYTDRQQTYSNPPANQVLKKQQCGPAEDAQKTNQLRAMPEGFKNNQRVAQHQNSEQYTSNPERQQTYANSPTNQVLKNQQCGQAEDAQKTNQLRAMREGFQNNQRVAQHQNSEEYTSNPERQQTYANSPTNKVLKNQQYGPAEDAQKTNQLRAMPEGFQNNLSVGQHQNSEQYTSNPERQPTYANSPANQVLKNHQRSSAQDAQKGIQFRGMPEDFQKNQRVAQNQNSEQYTLISERQQTYANSPAPQKPHQRPPAHDAQRGMSEDFQNNPRVVPNQDSEQYTPNPERKQTYSDSPANQKTYQRAMPEDFQNNQRVAHNQNSEHFILTPERSAQNRVTALYTNSPSKKNMGYQRPQQEQPLHQQEMRVMAQIQEESPRQMAQFSSSPMSPNYTSPASQQQFVSFSPQSGNSSALVSNQQGGRGTFVPHQQHTMYQGVPNQQSVITGQQYGAVNQVQNGGYEMTPTMPEREAPLLVEVSEGASNIPGKNDSLARYAKSPVSDDYSADPVSSPPPPKRGAAPAPGASTTTAAAPGLFDFQTPEQQGSNFLFNSFFKMF